MDASGIPIGEKRVVADNSHIKIVFTRLSHDYGMAEHFDPVSGRPVLTARLGIFTGSSQLQYLDDSFWKILVNGQPLGSQDLPQGGNMKTDVETRTINFTT